jgi:hypothetical protein
LWLPSPSSRSITSSSATRLWCLAERASERLSLHGIRLVYHRRIGTVVESAAEIQRLMVLRRYDVRGNPRRHRFCRALMAIGYCFLSWHRRRKKKLCDQAVSTLFTTIDAIELQRAMFLIRRLDCKISMRL